MRSAYTREDIGFEPQCTQLLSVWVWILCLPVWPGCGQPQPASQISGISEEQKETGRQETRPIQLRHLAETRAESHKDIWSKRCTAEMKRSESKARALETLKQATELMVAEVRESGGYQNGVPKVKNDRDAKRLLCPGREWNGNEPLLTTLGDSNLMHTYLIVLLAEGAYSVTPPLASYHGGRCPSECSAQVITQDPIQISTTESINDWVHIDETGKECDDWEAPGCVSGCLWMHHNVTHHFLDGISGRLVSIEAAITGLDDVDPFPPEQLVQVERSGRTVQLSACGVEETFNNIR